MAAVLHLAPHPDDELLGAPATLLGLRDAGHSVLNLACSLGSVQQRSRRRRELAAALDRVGLKGEEMTPPLDVSDDVDADREQRRLSETVARIVRRDGIALVVAPTPHDGHPTHELVGRAAIDAIARVPSPPRLWMWGFWADLPLPTLFVPFDDRRLAEIEHALMAHAGEVARNDYGAALRGRSRAARVLGVERTFGFGEPRKDGPYAFLLDDRRPFAELLTEAIHHEREWYKTAPRIPDFFDPLESSQRSLPIGWWLHEPSVRERERRTHGA